MSLIEREQGVALGTSYANGAMIHSSLVEPWNQPGIALKLLRWLGRDDAPAVLRPSAIPGLLAGAGASCAMPRPHATVVTC